MTMTLTVGTRADGEHVINLDAELYQDIPEEIFVSFK